MDSASLLRSLAAEAPQRIALGSVMPPVGAAVAAAASATPSVPAASSFLSSVFAPISTLGSVASVGWGWLSRHKKEVGIGVAVTTAVAGYYVYSKVQPMIAQFRAELQQLEQITAQMNPQAQPQQKHAIMLHRLEHNLTVGDVTLRQFAQTVRKDLMSRFDVDEIRSRLKKSAPSSSRSASDYLLWDEFKVAGFSRTLAALYVMCMLHALIKLQLSIVSRYVMFDQQAQQQRQEAEAAEQQQRGGQPAPPAPDASGPFAQPPTFLPPAVCEEVNRVYFSLSRHAQSVGAAQLSDHIASLVRQELAPWKALAGQVTRAELQSALHHIQDRVQSEALGLESKTDMEAQSGEPSENSASASGASAATTVYTSPHTYVRFLLPNSAGLSSLVGSTSFPDPHVNNMASFRLAEMVAETNALVNSGAFQCALAASFQACLGEMDRLLNPAFTAAAGRSQAAASSAEPADDTAHAPIPFANALVSTIKLFNVFLPDAAASGVGAPAASSVASPLFHILADLPAIKELCAVIYLPAEVLTQPASAQGQMSALQQITANTQFGPSSIASKQAAASAAQPPRLEIVDERSASSLPAASAVQANAAARRPDDVKGLPVFDRL